MLKRQNYAVQPGNGGILLVGMESPAHDGQKWPLLPIPAKRGTEPVRAYEQQDARYVLRFFRRGHINVCGARNKKTRNLVPLVMSSADGSSADSDTSREHEGVALAANAQGLGGAEHTGVGLISDATRILVINIRAPGLTVFPLRPHGEGPLRVSWL